ncbi:hypothetical protein BGZ68_004412 [Mortierella alpina]|nr:hypothetical protein BGZ68_004412 [Mortierella alpina]
MAPPKLHIQQIRFDNVIKRFPAKERNGSIYILLDDVRVVFKDAESFEYDGISIPFVTDDNDVRILPPRIAYYEDWILDVVVEDKAPLTPSSPIPIPIPSRQSTAPTTPDSSLGSVVSPLRISSFSTPPCVNVKPLRPVPSPRLPVLETAHDGTASKEDTDSQSGARGAREALSPVSPEPNADAGAKSGALLFRGGILPFLPSREIRSRDGSLELAVSIPVSTTVHSAPTVHAIISPNSSDDDQQLSSRQQNMYCEDDRQAVVCALTPINDTSDNYQQLYMENEDVNAQSEQIDRRLRSQQQRQMIRDEQQNYHERFMINYQDHTIPPDSQPYPSHPDPLDSPVSIPGPPPVPPRPPVILTSRSKPVHPFETPSTVTVPYVANANRLVSPADEGSSPASRLSQPLSPNQMGYSADSFRQGTDCGLEFIPEDTRRLQLEHETTVKRLELELHHSLIQTQLNAERSRESVAQMSARMLKWAMLMQNKVQEVLTQTHELHENPVPRLFIVLPVLMIDPTIPEATTLNRRSSSVSNGNAAAMDGAVPGSDQRKFRLHFLCECGNNATKPLRTSGLNHIHFVEHEGYEIVKPAEFFKKYGAFIRSLSHLLRCGTVSIPPLLSILAHQQLQQQQLQQQKVQDANSIYKAYALGQETLKNQILDTRLAEAIEYLDSLEAANIDLQDPPIEFFDGADVRQLQAYVNIPSPHVQSPAELYRIVTTSGAVKWICKEHYRSTVHQQNELSFQQEIANMKGHYDLKTGRATVRLGSAQDASQFYRSIAKAQNMQELDVGLGWSFNESDLQKFVQAVSETRIGILALDGCKLKTDPSVRLMNFGKKYDPLLRIIYGSKIGTLKLANMPSLLLKISSKPLPPTPLYGIKALHLQSVGVLDFSGPEKAGNALAMGLNIGNNSTYNQSQSIMSSLLTSFQTLSELVVPGMNIRDDGIRLLTEQKQLYKTLRYLNLSDNGISPVGGQLLASFLTREKIMAHLDLGMNAIGDEALALIIGGLGPRLSILNLESTGFGDKASRALERMVDSYSSLSDPELHIECLNLATNGWTTSGLQSLGRIIVKLRIHCPPPSSPSLTAPAPRKHDKTAPLEMGPAESFLIINSMIRTAQITLPADKPWHQDPRVLCPYAALTATKESYDPSAMKAQDVIMDNSKLKVLRLSDAGLSEGAARYLIGLLDMTILTKLDLRRCIRLFKPREMLMFLMRIYPNSSYQFDGTGQQYQRQNLPQGPAPVGVSGAPTNCLRFVHLNATGLDDHAARILAQDLQSGWSCIERLDIGSNNLTHQGIVMILDALCQNQTLQHLNLGQNFCAPNSVYPSSAAALAQLTREALKRFMMTNKTLQILYFICADIETVAQGLSTNSSIRSLVFDRLQGTLMDVEAFGKALAVNETLMRFKVYDGRQAPFLQAFYGHGSPHQMYHPQANQQQQIHYVDSFKEFKQDAIKTIEKGLTFNYSLIELQWPEMFERMQPWTDRLDAIMNRNMSMLKSALNSGEALSDKENNSAQRHGYRGSRSASGAMLSRGVSVLSTSSTLSTGSDNSSNSSLSSASASNLAGVQYLKDPMMNRSLTSFVPPPTSGPGDNYSYSVHSNSSGNSNNGGGYGHGHGNGNGGGGAGGGRNNSISGSIERRLSILDLSPWTMNQLRNAPSRDAPPPAPVRQTRAVRPEAETHIMQRFQKR